MQPADDILIRLLLETANAAALHLDAADRVLRIAHPAPLARWLARGQAPESGESLHELLRGLFTESQIATLSQAPLPTGPQLMAAKPSRQSPPRWFELTRVPMPADADCASVLLIVDRTEQRHLADALAEARVAQELTRIALTSDPAVLRQFLHNAASALGFIRTTLRQPSRTQQALRAKLGLLRNEADRLGVAAAQIPLPAVEQPARALVTALDALLRLEDASGDDMLPLAFHVDAISLALTTLSDLDKQRFAPAPSGRAAAREASAWHEVCEQRASEWVARVGAECGVLARLHMKGSAHVPEQYQRRIDACLEALIDNALRHGIETPQERISAGKPATGTITVTFGDLGSEGLEMTVHDDGRGFDLDRMRQAAVTCGLENGRSEQDLTPRELVALIFRPGFSCTATAGQTGSGHSMTLLREALRRHGGNVSVATKPEHFTRFHVHFPTADHRQRLSARRMAALTR